MPKISKFQRRALVTSPSSVVMGNTPTSKLPTKKSKKVSVTPKSVASSGVEADDEGGVLGVWDACSKEEGSISPFQLINYAKSRGVSSASRSQNLRSSFDRGFIKGMSTIMATCLPDDFDIAKAVKEMEPFQRRNYDSSKPLYGVISGSHRLKEALRRMEAGELKFPLNFTFPVLYAVNPPFTEADATQLGVVFNMKTQDGLVLVTFFDRLFFLHRLRETMGKKYSEYSLTGMGQYVDNLCKDLKPHYNLHMKEGVLKPIVGLQGSAMTWYVWVTIVEKFQTKPFELTWTNLVELNQNGIIENLGMSESLQKLPWMALKLFSLAAFQTMTAITRPEYSVTVLQRYICVGVNITVNKDNKFIYPVESIATEWAQKQGMYAVAAIYQVELFAKLTKLDLSKKKSWPQVTSDLVDAVLNTQQHDKELGKLIDDANKKLTLTTVEAHLKQVTVLIPCLQEEAKILVRYGVKNRNEAGITDNVTDEKGDSDSSSCAEDGGGNDEGVEADEVGDGEGDEGGLCEGGEPAGNTGDEESCTSSSSSKDAGEGGTSSAADALAQKQQDKAYEKLKEAGVYPIVHGDYKQVFSPTGFLGKSNCNGNVDYIITDPPWGVFENDPNDQLDDNHYNNVAEAISRLLKPCGNFLVYCSRAQKNYYRNAFSKTELGLKLDDVAITYNNRLNRGTKLKQSDKIRDVCFFALTGYKTSIGNQKRFLNYPWQGKRHRFNVDNAEYPNSSVVLYFPPSGRERMLDEKKRPLRVSQKPIELIKELIVIHCPPGGLVADLFSGTGTTAKAAYATNRRFVGCERDEVVNDYAVQSLLDFTRQCRNIYSDEVEQRVLGAKRVSKGTKSASEESGSISGSGSSDSVSASKSGGSSKSDSDSSEVEWASPRNVATPRPPRQSANNARTLLKKPNYLISHGDDGVTRILDVNFVDVVKTQSSLHRVPKDELTDASFYGCEVGPSKFTRAGLGLMAGTVPVKRNTKLRYFGDMHLMSKVSMENYLSAEEKQRAIDCDCAPADSPTDALVCVASLQCAAGYANHSSDPKRINCRFVANKKYNGDNADECAIYLLVFKEIAPGEEFWVNYGSCFDLTDFQTATDAEDSSGDGEPFDLQSSSWRIQGAKVTKPAAPFIGLDPHGDPWQHSATEAAFPDEEHDEQPIAKKKKAVVAKPQAVLAPAVAKRDMRQLAGTATAPIVSIKPCVTNAQACEAAANLAGAAIEFSKSNGAIPGSAKKIREVCTGQDAVLSPAVQTLLKDASSPVVATLPLRFSTDQVSRSATLASKILVENHSQSSPDPLAKLPAVRNLAADMLESSMMDAIVYTYNKASNKPEVGKKRGFSQLEELAKANIDAPTGKRNRSGQQSTSNSIPQLLAVEAKLNPVTNRYKTVIVNKAARKK